MGREAGLGESRTKGMDGQSTEVGHGGSEREGGRRKVSERKKEHE